LPCTAVGSRSPRCLHSCADDSAITVDGKDAYGGLKAIDKLKFFKRSESVSTTNLIERILAPVAERPSMYPRDSAYVDAMLGAFISSSPGVTVVLNSSASPAVMADCVYVRASWDMFSESSGDSARDTPRRRRALGHGGAVGHRGQARDRGRARRRDRHGERRAMAAPERRRARAQRDRVSGALRRALSGSVQYVSEVHLSVTNAWMSGAARTIKDERSVVQRFVHPVLERRDDYLQRNKNKRARDDALV